MRLSLLPFSFRRCTPATAPPRPAQHGPSSPGAAALLLEDLHDLPSFLLPADGNAPLLEQDDPLYLGGMLQRDVSTAIASELDIAMDQLLRVTARTMRPMVTFNCLYCKQHSSTSSMIFPRSSTPLHPEASRL